MKQIKTIICILILLTISTIGYTGGDNIKCEINDVKCQNELLEPVVPKVADFDDENVDVFIKSLEPTTPKVADFEDVDTLKNNKMKNEKNYAIY